ncbi:MULTISPECIES: APC family permease [unclassified Cryobacterium]|uniref:APC family permease n=1 Tax=unclassified Cryobacterium TaxID=2649013 RepID=UPI00106D7949|nr:MULTISPECIES: APC family permease [unclassified Cryobacterium]MEB0288626.1 APC family permease [Cryobacterium sp. 10S3]MEB0304437.1 APC family permease [Cryobacterium sp. 10I1]TFB94333.1 APC family permease [Cryobacterium sp. MDB2-A-1]TFC06219.1 APC family permease [Cryobacterium sp. MDB2-33-2]TFC11802.1 APC family permease [Cryobacterium sp. MDB2-A-2]
MTDSASSQAGEKRSDQVDSKGLKGGALGLLSSVVVGMASTAPAYSLAASLGFIVASGGALLAGVKAPGIVLLAFIPMYLIAVAYQELNKAEPDCGTTFTWATRAFGPITGWLGGWGIIAADVIVMANLAQVAGSYSFTFMGDLGLTGVADLANDQFWSTVAGVLWIVIMTWICYRGIELSARIQYVLLGIEVVVLIMFAVFALIRVYTGSAESYSLTPTLDWFNPFTLDFGSVIAPAVLTAVFIYWGWDTAVSVNEETADPSKTPGRAAIISTLLLLGTYALVTVAAVAFAGVGTDGVGLGNDANSADVFAAIGPALFGDSTLGNLAMLLLSASILTSASASTQTTILPTARTALSMGVYRALPARFAKIHPRYLTPTWATLAMGGISIGFYLLFTLISVQLLGALIGSVGLMIAFYYGLTGFACVWYYRRSMWSSFRNVIMRGLFPLLGGLMLTAAFVYGLQQYATVDWLTDDNGDNVTIFGIGAVAVVGIGALVLGVVVMLVWWAVNPNFFRGRTLPRQSDDLVLATTEAESIPRFGLPDSKLMPTMIAPDLSNLPPGQTAVNAETGEEVSTPGDLPPADAKRHPRAEADDE